MFTSGLPDGIAVPMSAALRDELRGAILVLPLAAVDIRTPVYNTASATDATPQRGGGGKVSCSRTRCGSVGIVPVYGRHG